MDKKIQSKFIQYLIQERGYAPKALIPDKSSNEKKWGIFIQDIDENYLATVNMFLVKGELDLSKLMHTEYKGTEKLFYVNHNIEDGSFSYYQMTRSDGLEKLDDFPTYEELKSIENEEITKNIAIPMQIKLRYKAEMKPTLGVKSIAKVMASIIKNYPEESGMMIGMFGNWGRGKTFLVEETWNAIVKESSNYKRVSFSAWKYQDTKESWAYLYEVFMQSYLKDSADISLDFIKNKNYLKSVKLNSKIESLEDKLNNFKFLKWVCNRRLYKLVKLNLNKFGWNPILMFILGIILFSTVGTLTLIQSFISTFGLFLVLKIVTFYFLKKTTAIELYKKYFMKSDYKNYLGLQAEIERELSLLLEAWIPDKVWTGIKKHNDKIVLFVDDIDRCDFEQITTIIDGLRVILDNEEIHKRLIIVLAIDDQMLEKAFKVKYKKLGFRGNRDLQKRYQEYLEKIFIIGIKLNELNEEEIRDFTKEFLPKYKEVEEKILIQPETTIWKKEEEKNKEGTLMCPVTTPAKYKTFQRIIEDKEFKSKEKEYSFVKYETISKNVDGKVKTVKIITKDYIVEITEEERLYLQDVIINLQNVTPRRIKILYYQFLLAKQLLYIRLNEKDLFKEWNFIADEKVIIDALIKKKNIERFLFEKSKAIEKELQYVVDMVGTI